MFATIFQWEVGERPGPCAGGLHQVPRESSGWERTFFAGPCWWPRRGHSLATTVCISTVSSWLGGEGGW